MTEDEVDVLAMSTKLRIPQWKIRRALDLPLSPLERIGAELVRRVETIEDAIAIGMFVNNESIAGRRAIRKAIKLAKDYKELSELCDRIPDGHSEMPTLHQRLVDAATTTEEFRDAWRTIQHHTPPWFTLISKIAETYRNDDGVVDVGRMADETHIQEHHIRWALKLPPSAMERPYLEAVEKAETQTALLDIWGHITGFSIAGTRCAEKLIALSTTREELLPVVRLLATEDHPLTDSAFYKLTTLTTRRFQLRELYAMAPRDSPMEDAVIRKLAEFFRKPEADEPTTNP